MDNVAEHVKPPRVRRRKPTVWTPTQLRTFLTFIRHDRPVLPAVPARCHDRPPPGGTVRPALAGTIAALFLDDETTVVRKSVSNEDETAPSDDLRGGAFPGSGERI
ncbi:hypothetical protein GCM10009835_52710 [Planosporangium flavigriseum]|uniref:Uncharacterized protein n=1 Tax=Planosporangium flavigriseum TaxID=373681 RepID=A0A8J3LSH1_9ACTN|nr:hypothetical protein Pfl04_42120 [Planosporangium flavigriseum]